MPEASAPSATVFWVSTARPSRQAHEAALTSRGFRVAWADSLAPLKSLAALTPPELVILDLQGNSSDPYPIVRRLRRLLPPRDLPVVVLSGRPAGADEERRALSGGADDCLADPVIPEVLCARVEAAIGTYRQFARPRPRSRSVLRSKDGRLILNLAAGECLIQEGPRYEDKRLTRKEFSVLALLLRKSPRIARWSDFRAAGWHTWRLGDESRTLVQHVMRLRVKLGELGRRIETVPGAGYRWNG